MLTEDETKFFTKIGSLTMEHGKGLTDTMVSTNVPKMLRTPNTLRHAIAWIVDQVSKSGYITTPEGKLDASATFRRALDHHDPVTLGVHRTLMINPRSAFSVSGGVGKAENARFCLLVPLIMSGFKEYDNVNYESWDRDSVRVITSPPLFEAMRGLHFPRRPLDLESRNSLVKRAVVRSGVEQDPISSTSMLKPPLHAVYPNLDVLSGYMLLQTWAAHPQNRNKYMILNPHDWDDMPEPFDSVHLLGSPDLDAKDPMSLLF